MRLWKLFGTTKILNPCILIILGKRHMDKERIFHKLKEIEDSLELIREGIPGSALTFSNLGLVKDGIYKRLEFCIQNLIDIFSGLRSKKVFSKDVLVLVEEMKGLRNILIHRYGKIDDDLVYALLTERLEDFEKITHSIEKLVRK